MNCTDLIVILRNLLTDGVQIKNVLGKISDFCPSDSTRNPDSQYSEFASSTKNSVEMFTTCKKDMRYKQNKSLWCDNTYEIVLVNKMVASTSSTFVFSCQLISFGWLHRRLQQKERTEKAQLSDRKKIPEWQLHPYSLLKKWFGLRDDPSKRSTFWRSV